MQNASVAFRTDPLSIPRRDAPQVTPLRLLPEQELVLWPLLTHRITDRCIIYGRPYDHQIVSFQYFFLIPAVESEVYFHKCSQFIQL